MQGARAAGRTAPSQRQAVASLQPSHAPVHSHLADPQVALASSRSVTLASASSPQGAPILQSRRQQRRRAASLVARASVPSFMSLPSVEGYSEVESIKGVRMILDNDAPIVQYLVQWKGEGLEPTWEKASDLSSDLPRNFEERWWNAARKAEFDTLSEMLAGGREVLAKAVDENRRSALHFAAALGKADCVKLLLEAGADPNLQDTQGYTPLHMAAGYMHTSTMTVLLQAGSDPQIKDGTGKDVVTLIEGLRNNMPLNLATVMQRLRLEEVANCLNDLLYEEVQAKSVLAERRAADGSRELLVSWADGREDSWVHERDVSTSLLEDWEQGYESAAAAAVLDMVQVGTERRFKIKWADSAYPDSWEPEEHVPEELIELFRSQNPALFQERVAAAATGAAGSSSHGASTEQLRPASQASPALAGRGGQQLQAAPVAALQTPAPDSVPVLLTSAEQQQPDRVLAGSL